MIRYIKKKLLDPKKQQTERKKAGILLSCIGIGFNLLLFALKTTAGAISGSIAITADGFNNLADTGSCVMALLGFRLGDRKPCRRYPYGYGRLEYLSGLLIAALILALGIRMMISSAAKIISPEDVDGKPAVILILIVSIAVKGYMYWYNREIGRLINSAGMKAAAMDSLSDCIATFAIIIAVVIENLTGVNVDGYTGSLVAACIIWAGIASAKDSLEPLLGMGIGEEDENTIRQIAQTHRNITGVYSIAVHDYGPQRKLITMYITVSGSASLTIRELKEEIENKLHAEAIISVR